MSPNYELGMPVITTFIIIFQLCRRGLEQVINSLYQENQSLSSQASTHLILNLLLVKEKCSNNNKIASLEAAAPAARAPQPKKEVKIKWN